MNTLAYYFATKFAQVGFDCSTPSTTKECTINIPKVDATGDKLQPILQILFGAIGVVTVIFIIIAAIRYSSALGNPEATAKLRNSIIWAAIGLVIVLSAEAIVTFVLGRV